MGNSVAGTWVSGAYVNDGSLNGNQTDTNANPGVYAAGGWNPEWWVNSWASPVQAYAFKSSKTTLTANTPHEWMPAFNNTGFQEGTNLSNLVIGQTGPYTSSNLNTAIVALYSPPSIPSGAKVVNYSSADTPSSVGANGSAVSPAIGASFRF